jgi:Ni,Fe-hydrogenase I large subunit
MAAKQDSIDLQLMFEELLVLQNDVNEVNKAVKAFIEVGKKLDRFVETFGGFRKNFEEDRSVVMQKNLEENMKKNLEVIQKDLEQTMKKDFEVFQKNLEETMKKDFEVLQKNLEETKQENLSETKNNMGEKLKETLEVIQSGVDNNMKLRLGVIGENLNEFMKDKFGVLEEQLYTAKARVLSLEIALERTQEELFR